MTTTITFSWTQMVCIGLHTKSCSCTTCWHQSPKYTLANLRGSLHVSVAVSMQHSPCCRFPQPFYPQMSLHRLVFCNSLCMSSKGGMFERLLLIAEYFINHDGVMQKSMFIHVAHELLWILLCLQKRINNNWNYIMRHFHIVDIIFKLSQLIIIHNKAY